MGLKLAGSQELPEQAWKEARTVWISDLTSHPASPRVAAARNQEMVSGWAVPVRAGSKVLAVLEFYCNFKLREDREAMAAVETAASSLGQVLARSQERGRTDDLRRQQEILLDSVTDGICGLDRDGIVTFANLAAARLLGAPADALIGKPVHELLHGAAPEGRACGPDCILRRATAQSGAAAGEENIFRSDGSSFPAEYVLTPIRGQSRSSGFVLSFRDIGQRYALDRLKDEFISTVSHELRTPLTSLRASLGLVFSGTLDKRPEKQRQMVEMAIGNCDRLIRLVNDILDFERVEKGDLPLYLQPVEAIDLLRRAADVASTAAGQAHILVRVEAPSVQVLADEDRILQVLNELVTNAIKFSLPETTISLTAQPFQESPSGSATVCFTVEDQGRGIPPEKLDRVFDRFQQGDASDSRALGGTGLGLALCRSIVEQHGGRIWAESIVGQGSRFHFTLPTVPRPAL
jgi:PAS domain S-box-containing protein